MSSGSGWYSNAYDERTFAKLISSLIINRKGLIMKKQLIMLLITLLLLMYSNAYAQIDQIPDWFISPPSDNENIYAVGEGSSIGIALMFALGELSGKLDSKVDAITKTFVDEKAIDNKNNSQKVITSNRFNNVKIMQMIKDFAENDYSEYQIVAKMNYEVGEKTLEIRGFIKESGKTDDADKNIEYEFSDKAVDCDINDVIKDLENYGLALTIFSSDKFYVMIAYPIP